jgi:hypothetical protein
MRHGFHAAFPVGAIALSLDGSAPAAEGGTGACLLGSRGPMAGFTPPGISFQDDSYICDEKPGGGHTLPMGGLLVANVTVSTRFIARAEPGKTVKARF